MVLLLLLASGVGVGIFRYAATTPGTDSVSSWTGEMRSVEGTIVRNDQDVSSQALTLNRVHVDETPVSGRVLVFAPGYPKVTTGQMVQLRCELDAPEPFDGFAYDRFLASKKIYATCFTKDVPFVQSDSRRFVALDRLHEHTRAVIDRIFGEPQSSLLAGLLMGDNTFSDTWKTYFLRTGTSHVVAASGTNVSMLSLVLMAALISLGFKRQRAYPIILLGLAGFVIIAGGGAAVARAGVMGALALTATQLGRKTSPRNLILLTVVGMLLANPLLLRDDAGFQLSVVSTIGLILMAKSFSEKLAFIPETFGLRESFASTLAATLATLPIVIFGFHRLSLISPFVNLLVLPFIPYAMFAGAVATAVGVVSQSLGAIAAGPAWLFLTIMLEVIKSMSALPFAVMHL